MIPRWLDNQMHTESHFKGWLLGLRPLLERSSAVLTMRHWTASRMAHPQPMPEIRPLQKD
jgi:hypothetical protein